MFGCGVCHCVGDDTDAVTLVRLHLGGVHWTTISIIGAAKIVLMFLTFLSTGFKF